MSNVIYCYSGTGNSLDAAKVIAETLGNTKVVSMNDENIKHDASNTDIIGFVFPVHHWNMPTAVRTFASKVALHQNAYIFAIAACGGIAVNALNDFNDLIIAKGAVLSYSKILVNVSQYIVAYDRFPNPEKQLPKTNIALRQIADDIKNHIHNKPAKSNLLKKLLRLGMSRSVKKFPIMDKYFIVSDTCIACGICKKVCSAKNINIENSKPVFLHKCEQCMACIQYCPQKAINYKNKTQRRERYHHPNINAEELVFFRNNSIMFISKKEEVIE
jgi:ferredoxin